MTPPADPGSVSRVPEPLTGGPASAWEPVSFTTGNVEGFGGRVPEWRLIPSLARVEFRGIMKVKVGTELKVGEAMFTMPGPVRPAFIQRMPIPYTNSTETTGTAAQATIALSGVVTNWQTAIAASCMVNFGVACYYLL